MVLLHGLGRGSLSMVLLERRLAARGFRVANLDYPSRAQPVEDLVANLAQRIETCCPQARKLHFVGHSLGGILIRRYVQAYRPANLGRAVMLSPPNQGSELADVFKDNAFYRFATGPVGQELGTAPDSVPNRLGPVTFEVGVITGSLSLNPFLSSKIPGADDGKVAVERAKVAGMRDFLAVAHSHTYIMNSCEVAAQTAYFLIHGRFYRGAEQPKPSPP